MIKALSLVVIFFLVSPIFSSAFILKAPITGAFMVKTYDARATAQHQQQKSPKITGKFLGITGREVQQTCTDSDSSASYNLFIYEGPLLTPSNRPDVFVKGTTNGPMFGVRNDTCTGNYLSEMLCNQGSESTQFVHCTYACNDGACLTNITTNQTCTPVVETCNGVDDNCNGLVDENVTSVFYRDLDGDGFGDPAVVTRACSEPFGFVSNNFDCDDSHSLIYPSAVDVCNGVDDNCNGLVDEGCVHETDICNFIGDLKKQSFYCSSPFGLCQATNTSKNSNCQADVFGLKGSIVLWSSICNNGQKADIQRRTSGHGLKKQQTYLDGISDILNVKC